jgi:hypothetical protein
MQARYDIRQARLLSMPYPRFHPTPTNLPSTAQPVAGVAQRSKHRSNPGRNQQHSPLPTYPNSNGLACAYAQTCCTARDRRCPAAAMLLTPNNVINTVGC